MGHLETPNLIVIGCYAAGMILMRLNKGEEVAGLAISGDGRETDEPKDVSGES